MPSPYDFHIHTTYLKCANETMTVPALVRRCEELGLEAIAITDHLNAPEFLPKHDLIKQDLAEIQTGMKIYFGVEVNVIDRDTGAVSIDEAQLAQGASRWSLAARTRPTMTSRTGRRSLTCSTS
jgi:histidinol phosphatase-like PHP family hydrolase